MEKSVKLSEKSKSVRFLAVNGMIAALYVALTFTVPALSFSVGQFRLSEALVVLPVFAPYSVVGLTVGCFLSNLLGTALSVNMLFDCIFGTAATLLAGLLTAVIGKAVKGKQIYVWAALPAVVLNGLVVGAELALLTDMGTFWYCAASVALGETVVCYSLGTVLLYSLRRNGLYKKIL